MKIQNIELGKLRVNRSNDRHGELENETAAIGWLFRHREAHMRILTKDIVATGGIYELPLVSSINGNFVVFDGNRRVTCLKLLERPKRAPTAALQDFFSTERSKWVGNFPTTISCQVENDRDKIDEILYRRHTGTQGGIGQSTWDDRMKATFVARTGKHQSINVADEIEKELTKERLQPRSKIPRSTLNRLLSAEQFRNRLGISVSKEGLKFTHDRIVALNALARVARDLSSRELVLGDIWDSDGKNRYLKRLESEGVLPSAAHLIKDPGNQKRAKATRKTRKTLPSQRKRLIPELDFGIVWPARLQRHHNIWDELQFELSLSQHPNAISVLLRVLIELAVENYIAQNNLTIHDNDKLADRVRKVANDMRAGNKIEKKHLEMLGKFQHSEKIISADTLNRYVHSPTFAPSPEHLKSIWDSLAAFIVLCLKA